MIGTKYTPELLAALAKTPHLKSMGVSATPDGRRIASYTKRYTDDWVCKTTFFDVGDVELASTTVDCGIDGERFGSILGCACLSSSTCGLKKDWISGPSSSPQGLRWRSGRRSAGCPRSRRRIPASIRSRRSLKTTLRTSRGWLSSSLTERGA